MGGHLDRILRQAEGRPLLEVLAEHLSPTDLQSLLLEVYRARAGAVTPARLLQRFEEDRFCRLVPIDPRRVLEFDRMAFDACAPFVPIELPPVAPLGTCSVVATVAQDKVISTIRNSEVVADPTNVLALECAVRRRKGGADRVRLAASHRVVRAQDFGDPRFSAHFRIFGLVTGGRDAGSFRFETAALREQAARLLSVLHRHREAGARFDRAHLALTVLNPLFGDILASEVISPLQAEFPEARIDLDPDRQSGRGYYQTVCFKLYVLDPEGGRIEVGDGGFTDWTQQLLANRKERLLISALGTDRLIGLVE